jgi:hypothetical protein
LGGRERIDSVDDDLDSIPVELPPILGDVMAGVFTLSVGARYALGAGAGPATGAVMTAGDSGLAGLAVSAFFGGGRSMGKGEVTLRVGFGFVTTGSGAVPSAMPGGVHIGGQAWSPVVSGERAGGDALPNAGMSNSGRSNSM